MSPFSVHVRKEVLKTFPEWEKFAAEETYKNSEPYFVVAVPVPAEADISLPLRISTWDDEIAVDFDYYHTHFDRWEPAEGDNRHQSALLFVDAVLSETVGAASWWQGEHLKMASQFEPDGSLQPRFKIAFSKVRVRSWRGSLNANSDA